MLRTIRSLLFSLSLVLVSLASPAARLVPAKTPLFFEPNRGQAPTAVRYLLREGPAEAQFGERGFTLALPSGKDGAQFVRFDFSGAAAEPVLTPLGKLGGQTNYLQGQDPAQWVRHVPNYGQLRYAGVYPGIDVLFYGAEQRLEHDFEVAPRADPTRIALRVRGARSLSVTRGGDLAIGLEKGTVELRRPYAYQEEAGQRRGVKAAFLLAKDGTVRFRVGAYDRRRQLTIDPVLVFSTYVDALPSLFNAMATDAAGNTYVVGQTSSFSTTAGAFQAGCSKCVYPTIYVAKLNAAGNEEIYGTMLGSSNNEGARSIAVDWKGNAIVAGFTVDSNFPTKNPLIPPPQAGLAVSSGFIASLTADGSALNYSTLIPSRGSFAATVDSSDNVYFTGPVNYGFYFATSGALNEPGADTFVSKLGPTGALVYTAFLGPGGSFLNGPTAIAADAQGSAYITGTADANWPTTTGAYLGSDPSGDLLAYVTKLHPDGSKLDYSTFVGPGAPAAIGLDSNSDAWIAGSVTGSGYPLTSNAYDSTAADTGFFSEISPDGTQLPYSSLLNTAPPYSRFEALSTLVVDSGNHIWLGGQAGSDQFPLRNPLVSWGQSGFVAEFDPTGTQLQFSTFFGSAIQGLAVDPLGKVHIAGQTDGSVYTSPGSFATLPEYASDYYEGYSFVAAIDLGVAAPAICTNIPSFNTDPFYPVEEPSNMVTGSPALQLTNCGNAPLTFQSTTTSEPAYTIASSTCSGTLAVGDGCSMTLNFSPAGVPSCNATLTIISNASMPTLVPLTLGDDTGCYASRAAANLSPKTLSFSSEAVGATSAPQAITLTNPGSEALEISQIAFTAGDFAETDSCGGAVKPLGSCTLSVTFTPLADGARNATLGVFDNAGDSPEAVQLSGTGTGPAPAVSLSTRALLFPTLAYQTTSEPQTLTVTNTGQGPLSITSVTIPDSGLNFAETNNCVGILAAGATCTIAVTYTQIPGNFLGTLTITDNAGDSPQTVALLGDGESGVSLSASPATLTLASAGGVATSTITLTPLSSAGAGNFTLNCAVIWEGTSTATPLAPACNILPNQVNVTSSGGKATLSLSTEMFKAEASPGPLGRSAPVLALLVCFFLVPRRRWRGGVLIVLLLALTVGGISACGGGGSPSVGGVSGGGGGANSGATPGAYVVQVYGTSPGTAPIVLGTNVNLTVQ